MLDECSNINQIKLQREETANNLTDNRMSSSLDSSSGLESTGSSVNHFTCAQTNTGNSISEHRNSSSNIPRASREYVHSSYIGQIDKGYNPLQPQTIRQIRTATATTHHSSDEQYFTSDETNSSNQNLDTVSGSIGHLSHIKTERGAGGASGEPGSSGVTSMVPTTAHCSGQQMIHYSISNSKSITAPSPSNMALNFSHDLLHHTNHHGQSALHHHSNDNNGDHKPTQLELDSGSLMQTAAGMNMWKNTMNLNFKHSPINDHSFLPASDMNSFPGWTPSGNLSHQPTSNMTQHILEQGQHLIYPQHNQRSLHLTSQDLGASLKNHTAEQASFMLNSINHQQVPISSHHTPHQSNDNPHHRNQALDHTTASYNLSVNDGHFYNNRSQSSSNKSSLFLQDRSGPVSLSNHPQNHLTYHSADHLNPQPTTSHHVAGTSSGMVSKNIGTFRCPHCNELFNMRNLYQSHLKTHSQEKGSKAKFHCEICSHSFSQKTSLNRHMKSHTGERPFPCEVCGKAFSEKERLKIHMRTHTGEKPFSCGICGKSFSQKSTVKRHQTVHTGEKKFKCDCGKGFANRGNLIAHIKTRGSNHFE